MMKIALTGKMRSGKDTVAEIMGKYARFNEIKFSKGITEIIENYLPEVASKGKDRYAYQVIGQSLREIDPLIWVKYSIGKAIGDNVIITDLRQQNEYEYLKEHGFIIIKVESNLGDRINRMKELDEDNSIDRMNHETERFIDLIEADYTINNFWGLEELEWQVYSVITKILENNENKV